MEPNKEMSERHNTSRPSPFFQRTGPPRDEAAFPVPPPESIAPARDGYHSVGSCAELVLGGRGNFRHLDHFGGLALSRSVLREIHVRLGLKHSQFS